MRIKIEGYEESYELRALATLLTALADHREAQPPEGAVLPFVAASPVELSAGDAPSPFIPEPAAPAVAVPEAPAAPAVPAAPRKSRAKKAVETASQQVPLIPEAPTAPTAPDAPEAPIETAAPAVPTAPVVPPAPVAPSATPSNFAELMRALAPLLAGGKLTADNLNRACAEAGCTNLQGLIQNQALVPSVFVHPLVQAALSS